MPMPSSRNAQVLDAPPEYKAAIEKAVAFAQEIKPKLERLAKVKGKRYQLRALRAAKCIAAQYRKVADAAAFALHVTASSTHVRSAGPMNLEVLPPGVAEAGQQIDQLVEALSRDVPDDAAIPDEFPPVETIEVWILDFVRECETPQLKRAAKLSNPLGRNWTAQIAVRGHAGLPAMPSVGATESMLAEHVREKWEGEVAWRHKWLPDSKLIARIMADLVKTGHLRREPDEVRGATTMVYRLCDATKAVLVERQERSAEHASRDTGPRCAPMSKNRIAARVQNKPTARFRDVEDMLTSNDLRSHGNGKWSVALAGFDAATQHRLCETDREFDARFQ